MGSCMSSPEEPPSQITSTGGTVYVSTGKSSQQLKGRNNNSNNNGHSNGDATGGTNKLSENGLASLKAESTPNSTSTMPENKKAQRERSYAIDKQIEEDSKKYRKECKILLLGEFKFLNHTYKSPGPTCSIWQLTK